MMQKKVQIISDGSLDLSQELTKEKDIEVVPFYVSFDSETYQKEMVEVGVREFYQEMVDHPTVFPKTSMPSVHDYYEVFEKHAKEKMPVICICITKKFSGSLQSATTAKDMILEEYPDAQITVIDSTVNTVLQGLYVLEACKLRDMGLEYQQIVDALLPIRETGRIFFTIGSIDYLKHGGRIGKLAGIASSALSLKPLITLVNGEIEASGIGRSRKKTVAKTIALMDDYFKETGDAMEDYSFRVGFGYDIEEGKEYYNTVANHIYGESHVDQVGICQIGATIAVHTGPYAIGIGCVKKYENYL